MISLLFDFLVWVISLLYRMAVIVTLVLAIFFVFLVPKRWHPRWMRRES